MVVNGIFLLPPGTNLNKADEVRDEKQPDDGGWTLMRSTGWDRLCPPPFLRGHQSVGAVGKGDDRWLFDGFDRGGEYLERC